MLPDFSEYEHSSHPPSEARITSAETILDMKFGSMLKEYLATYGYLACEDVEFYGLAEDPRQDDGLTRRTLAMRETAYWTRNFAAILDLGDGLLALCDSDDMVYIADIDANTICANSISLAEYLDYKLKEAKSH